jgi:glutamyl-tRNA synthetase
MARFGVQLEEDDEFMDYVSKDSWHEAAALGDANMRALQAGDVVQLERKGYFRVDEALTAPGKPLLLFAVPDGRAKKG